MSKSCIISSVNKENSLNIKMFLESGTSPKGPPGGKGVIFNKMIY